MVARSAIEPRRFEIYLCVLDPAVGSEIRKTRPCVIVSPDEANHKIGTVIIAPMTSGGHAYPTRIPIVFQHKSGHVILDQMRTLDKSRLSKKLGAVDGKTAQRICAVLQEMFAYHTR